MTADPISFGARLRQLAQQRGDAEAVLFVPAQGAPQSLSWRALDALVDRFAHGLRDRGVGQGDVVGFALGNVPAHLAMALAIWRLGATTMVLDPGMKPEPMAAMKARSNAALIVTAQPGGGDLDLARFEAEATAPAKPLPELMSNPGKIVLSGGSTGLPKMMADARDFARIPGHSWGRVAPRLGFRCDQTQLICGAMSHNAPFTWAQNGLFEGNRLVLMERFDARRALELIDSEGIGFAMLVPTMMVRMLDVLDDSGASLSSLHALYHTGAPCPAWLKQAWIDRIGAARVTEMYGSGENTGQTVVDGTEWLERPGTVGRGFETAIRIYGPTGELLPAGETGEIYMKPDDLGGRSSYIGPDVPAPTRDADGYQSIGDVGWLDQAGYLFLGGRRDDVINTGGVKVHPETIEAVLLRHANVGDAVVFGVPDRDWGERIVACIVPRRGALDRAALAAFCAAHLSPAEIPKQIETFESLPRDGFGKIRRKALKADFSD